MTEESIKSIFSKVNIKTKDIKRATNSFNSNVYIVLSDNNKKYILKFYKNENKMVCESKYMIYLKNYLLVADIITTGIFNGKYYTIQTFLEGENLFDEKANELNKIQKVVNKEMAEASKEVLLVIDATTGQNAISQVKAFKEQADITGIVLTKLDGTAKGGAVVGIVQENDIPVKFIGVGEQIDDMEIFNSKDFVKAII